MKYLESRLQAVTPLLAFLLTLAAAEDVVYVTDLPIYSDLAPCAAFAISVNIADQTYTGECPEAVTALQSCICIRKHEYISSLMSGMISVTCGSTASEDQASASTVLRVYCNQDEEVAFPTAHYPVSSYIHEIPAITELAPCASAGLSLIVRLNTDSYCPPDPTALAPCVCEKNQNSLRVSQSINTGIGAGCSKNKEDIKSAQALFAAYCAMNSGTTSFPTTTPPPGDMSYYINDLPQYSSLESCAQVGLNLAVIQQTRSLCPTDGPQALASCICLKTMISKTASSLLTSDIRWRCNTKMLDNLSSANAVLEYYCNAAKGEVTPTGILGSQTGDHGTSLASGPSATGTNVTDEPDHRGSKGPSAGVIAGAVVGAVLGCLVGAVIVFCLMRRRGRGTTTPDADPIIHTPRSADTQLSVPQQSEHRAGPEDDVSLHIDDDAVPPPYEQAVYGTKSKRR